MCQEHDVCVWGLADGAYGNRPHLAIPCRKEGGNLTRVPGLTRAFYNAFHNFFRSRVEQVFGVFWHFALIRIFWTGQAEHGGDKFFKRVKVLLNAANFYARRYHSMDCAICACPVPWFLTAFPLQTPKNNEMAVFCLL